MYRSNLLRFFSSMIVFGLPLVALSENLLAYNMQDAVYQTLQHHPDILRSKAESAAADQDIHVAQGGLYPSLDITAAIGRENSDNPATRGAGYGSRTFTRRESGALLRQLIYDGGNVRGTVKQRRFDYDASRHRITERQEELAYQAVAAYHGVLNSREVLAIQRLNVNAHRDLVNKVKRSLEAGASRKSELSLANARLALSIARLEAAQGYLENACDTFTKITGQRPPESLEKPGLPKNLPRTEAQARTSGLEINPSIKVTSSQAQALSAAIGVAEAAFYPRFTLDLSKSYNNNLDGVPGANNESLATLRMTYNLLNGGSDRADVRASRDREQASIEQLANIKRSIEEDISLSWNDLESAKAQLPYQKQHRDDSLDVFNAYVKQFQLGQRTLFDLLNAQAEYYDASINYINGKYDISKGSYRLLASMGNLVNTLSQGHAAIEKAAASPFNHETVASVPPSAVATNKISREIADIMGNEETPDPEANTSAMNKLNNQYTLQLYAATSEVAAKQFIEANHLSPHARVAKVTMNGQILYRVLNGQYASQSEAQQAIASLPSHIRMQHPLVRPVLPEGLT